MSEYGPNFRLGSLPFPGLQVATKLLTTQCAPEQGTETSWSRCVGTGQTGARSPGAAAGLCSLFPHAPGSLHTILGGSQTQRFLGHRPVLETFWGWDLQSTL